MYRVLSQDEIQLFVERYFPIWKKDITSVSCVKHEATIEYLINNHYLFII